MNSAATTAWAQDWNAPDEFGVPSNMFGRHPEEFFGRLSRIVMVASLLEHRLLSFYQSLKGIPQHEETNLAASTVVSNIRKDLLALSDANERGQVKAWLDESDYLLDRRNHYVHDLWPAQDGDRIYGWRFDRKATPASPTKHIDLTPEEMQTDLRRFLDAVRLWERLFPMISRGQHIAATGGAS